MIKKLQRKFVLITMESLFFVLLLMVVAINGINYYQMQVKIDGAMQILSENQGRFPEFKKGNEPPKDPHFDFQMNEETAFEVRYFVINVDEDGSVEQIDTGHIAAISSSDAITYANSVIESGQANGFEGIYKFKVVEQSHGSMILFMDCRSQLQSFTALLLISSAVALLTLLITFILVSVFSRKAISPIIISLEKQKQFITDAGHEIKTPLAIISANADVLELTTGGNEWIGSIRNQVVRLDKLVKNLLVLSKVGEDNIELIFTDLNISKTVAETAASFEAIAEMQSKEFLLTLQPDLKIRGDETSIQQLVSTLIDNALKYSNENGTIQITLSSTKKGVLLEFYNTTDSIETENLERLFDRFYRPDSSRSRETGGYGIGLSIAKSIVDAHHGKISARSEDGKSICFSVLL